MTWAVTRHLIALHWKYTLNTFKFLYKFNKKWISTISFIIFRQENVSIVVLLYVNRILRILINWHKFCFKSSLLFSISFRHHFSINSTNLIFIFIMMTIILLLFLLTHCESSNLYLLLYCIFHFYDSIDLTSELYYINQIYCSKVTPISVEF